MGNNKLLLNTLLNNQKAFIDIFSRYYPIPLDLLEKGKKLWNWEDISSNTKINWNIDLLYKYEDLLQWSYGSGLIHNLALPWSEELIKTFVDRGKWQWEDLMVQEKIIQNPQLLAFCLSYGEKSKNYRSYELFQCISWGENAGVWAHSIVENCPNLRWDWLSKIEQFPWTVNFIEKYKNKLNWYLLSCNKGLPWSIEFIKQFEDYLYWDNILSYIPHLPWSLELLKAKIFENRWKWSRLADREDIEWTQEIVEQFSNKIFWVHPLEADGYWQEEMYGIIDSYDFIWTPKLFEKIKKDVENHFKFLEEHFALKELNKYWTYYCRTNNWSPEFFDVLYEKEKQENIQTINWEYICQFAEHLWNNKFIEDHFNILIQYLNHCHYVDGLCSNPYFPWNKYLHKFTNFLDERAWLSLHENPNFTPCEDILMQYKDIWQPSEWEYLGKRINLNMKILDMFEDKWSFHYLSSNPTITPDMIAKYIDKPWDWYKLHLNNIQIPWEKIDINRLNPRNWKDVFNYHTNIRYLADDELLALFLENSHL